MLASSEGFTEIVKVLAEAKVDPNITDMVKYYCTRSVVHTRSRSCISLQDGDTALILAVREHYTHIVEILMEHGTDIDISNKVSE